MTDEVKKQQGQGGPPMGQGGKATCECAKCGFSMEHTERGVPCNKFKCPKCGAVMGPPGGEHGFQKDTKKSLWDGVL